MKNTVPMAPIHTSTNNKEDYVVPATSPENMVRILLTVVAGVTTILAATKLFRWYRIKARILNKQKQCKDAIKQLQDDMDHNGIPKKEVERILGLKFSQLKEKLRKGELKAVTVLKAYQTRALETNKTLNFMVEPVKEAMEYAKQLDKELENGKDPRPLHGIPVSIKENYYLKGYDSTGGMSIFVDKPALKDGPMVSVLKELGCVPFVRTNIPQSMMTFECSNPLYGTTVNPHNHGRGPGGSSGGEGAILGAESSILGFGSDIGGSLRIPSHFCGVFCLKPTAGRLGYRTTEELVHGQTLVTPTIGPMGRDVDTIVTAMKDILCPRLFTEEPQIPPMAFNTQLYESKRQLRIGYYVSDGYVPPIPGVERGLLEAKVALERFGHTLVPFEVPDAAHMFSVLFSKAAFGDGGHNFLSQMAEDRVDPSISLLVKIYRLPNFLIRLLSHVVSFFSKEKPAGTIMRNMLGVDSVYDWWKLAHEITIYKEKFYNLWQEQNLDAIICPTMPYVAPPTGTVKYLLGGVTYTTLYNVINYPAGCVPVTKVTAIDQKNMANYPSNTQTQKFIKKYYSTDTAGLPVAVQCVALPYREEMALRVMKDLESGLRHHLTRSSR
ncbi:fatty-acid amide hydrolase 1-like isoform X2 [Mya arenaria]|uniref:fatty-acid amide hydrolase 1-like isoform X2 n=1 Tax=Mya arenaria TaxID=6604 RepID=UPI0022E84C93|nr:fatty-acid amide hydrolase 1-like isoform X2 [Mya arenaria]